MAKLKDFNLGRLKLRGTTLQDAVLRRLEEKKKWPAGTKLPPLSYCVLPACDLRGVHFCGSTFVGVGFNQATLSPIIVEHATCIGFWGCLFNYRHPIIQLPALGAYSNSWAYHDGKTTRIRVGCRNFTLAQARDHWLGRDERREMIAAVDFVQQMAQTRGWPL